MITTKDYPNGPETEPVTLTEAKLFLRKDGNDEDALITALLKAARINCEMYINQSTIYQTRTLYVRDADDLTELNLVHPLVSVTSFKKYAEDGSATTYTTDDFVVQPAFAKLILKSTAEPINTTAQEYLEVVYVTGFGEIGEDVPHPIKQAILHTVAYGYENRDNNEPMPEIAKQLLNPYRDIPL